MLIGYIAGFFDGEGSIGIYRNGRGLFHLRTQLTQNAGAQSEALMKLLVGRFGGHYSRQRTTNGGTKFNWQLSSLPASRFLAQIEPHLLLKREQAQLAVAWQLQRPLPTRDEKGRMRPYAVDDTFDSSVSILMKELKKGELKAVLESRPDLREAAVKLGCAPLREPGSEETYASSGYSPAEVLQLCGQRRRRRTVHARG